MERYEYLRDCICELVSIAEEFVERERFGELDNAGADIIGLLIELNNYKDAEEQGLLLRLPFRIGQKLYYIYASCIDGELMIGSMIYSYSCLDFPREYFATKEEAEQKLASMQKGE